MYIMKIKQIVGIGLVSVLLGLYGGTMVYAADTAKCGGVETAIIECNKDGFTGSTNDVEKSGLFGVLSMTIKIMSGLIGIIAVCGLAYGGFIYASAENDQSRVNEGRTIIRNVIIGIIFFSLMVATLNFILPGRIFS